MMNQRRVLLVGGKQQVTPLEGVLRKLGLTDIESVPGFLAAVRAFLANPYGLIVTAWDPNGTDMLLKRARNQGPGQLTDCQVPIIIFHEVGTHEMSALANDRGQALVMIGKPPWNEAAVRAKIALLTSWDLVNPNGW
jgi:hypothetical protein